MSSCAGKSHHSATAIEVVLLWTAQRPSPVASAFNVGCWRINRSAHNNITFNLNIDIDCFGFSVNQFKIIESQWFVWCNGLICNGRGLSSIHSHRTTIGVKVTACFGEIAAYIECSAITIDCSTNNCEVVFDHERLATLYSKCNCGTIFVINREIIEGATVHLYITVQARLPNNGWTASVVKRTGIGKLTFNNYCVFSIERGIIPNWHSGFGVINFKFHTRLLCQRRTFINIDTFCLGNFIMIIRVNNWILTMILMVNKHTCTCSRITSTTKGSSLHIIPVKRIVPTSSISITSFRIRISAYPI